jgi:nucleoside-diphosphate-sugar epimerase
VGASGFIGGWLAEFLSLNGAYNVIAGIRSWSNAARIGRFPLEIVVCDIMNRKQIEEAMSNVTIVVNCAMGDSTTIVEGTKNLLEIAQNKGVRKFIYLSSAVVYGDVSGEVDENFPIQFTGNEYTDSKIIAEKLCWEYHEKGVPVTILRPSIVYGPFSKGWTIDIAEKLFSEIWKTFDGFGEGICNLIYVKDLISAIIMAVQSDRAIGEIFNVNGPDIVTWNEYFEQFNNALKLPQLEEIGRTEAKLRALLRDGINYFSSFTMHHFRELVMKVYNQNELTGKLIDRIRDILNFYPSDYELNKLYKLNCVYMSTKIRDMLGFVPNFDLSAGLYESVVWLKHHGFVK